jgi:hypothetical protein
VSYFHREYCVTRYVFKVSCVIFRNPCTVGKEIAPVIWIPVKQHYPPLAWGLGEGLTNLHCKKPACYEMLHRASELVGSHEHSNDLLGTIKYEEIMTIQVDYGH